MDVTLDDHGPTLRDVLITNYGALTRRLGRRLGCPDLARECLHDAWLHLGEIAATPAVRCPDAYLYQMVCNLATNRLRSDRLWQHTDDFDAEFERFVDPVPDAESAAEARSDLEFVQDAYQRLPSRHKSVLYALRIEEQSRQEVAARHGISLRTVDTTLRQALQHCAERAQRQILAGVGKPRRNLPSRWLEPAAQRFASIRERHVMCRVRRVAVRRLTSVR